MLSKIEVTIAFCYNHLTYYFYRTGPDQGYAEYKYG